MRTTRWALAAAVLFGLVACGSGEPSPTESKAAVAAAMCHTPVERRLHIHRMTVDFDSQSVEDLGAGRLRVTGVVPATEGVTPGGTFTCVVVPDPTDRLRGLRIERLAVRPQQG